MGYLPLHEKMQQEKVTQEEIDEYKNLPERKALDQKVDSLRLEIGEVSQKLSEVHEKRRELFQKDFDKGMVRIRGHIDTVKAMNFKSLETKSKQDDQEEMDKAREELGI